MRKPSLGNALQSFSRHFRILAQKEGKFHWSYKVPRFFFSVTAEHCVPNAFPMILAGAANEILHVGISMMKVSSNEGFTK